MRTTQQFILRSAAVIVAGLFGVATSVIAEPTKIANGPLAAAAASVKPNLMYIIDDSGSMQQDATPDYVQNEKLCRRSADHTNTSSSNIFLEFCRLGDPPYMNYDFNFQYYNPAVRYSPALKFDGSSYGDQDPAATKTDSYGVRTWNQFYQYGNTATVNLLTQYPDRVWCDDASRANSDTANCKANGPGWLYPNNTNRYSRDTSFNAKCGSDYPDDSPPGPDYQCSSSQGTTVAHPKYRYGAPYYYNIITATHCTNDDMTTCTASATPTTIAGVAYNVPSKIRFCDTIYLTNCQARKLGAFQYPNFNGVGATGSFTIATGGGGTSITSVKVNGVELLNAATNSSSNASTIANRVATEINGFISSPDYVAVSSGNTVRITATTPGTGNGLNIVVTQSGTMRTLTISALAGAVAPAAFQRVDIVPATATYPKNPARQDCAGATCTYAEEIKNFANWYSYYRTRMTMLKSAVGRTFIDIDDKYRVGYITINPGSPVSSSRFLAINDFAGGTGGQKDNWYAKLYSTGFNGSTPLREALSRVGRYFAGSSGGINDGMPGTPIQLSCQQNFTILSTDGYWNGNGGQDLTGNALANYDNALGSGANQVPRPLYDGGNASASGTLADVAQYYYQTDLSALTDNVPTTQRDTAAHQHMTTFTIGLGLAGQLKYENNYLTSTTGDFQKLKQGTIDWPVPAADTETALDDLWHAAVNGRGQFFSARDPQDVVDGLTTALNSLTLRIGAGAAAATSNLQPVAGDNFAFTAEYTTVQWTGDLKARTLDLSTGTVSSTVLWSAMNLLETRTAGSRTILTATTDTSNFPSKLKPFAWTGSGSAYPSDTPLTAAEQAFFNPNLLPQYAGWSTGQRTTATAKNLVEFLRGDKTNYITGASPEPDTDLYRARVKLLGDIINAQPSYVRASPLGYNDFGFTAFQACTAGTGSGCPSGLSGPRIGTVFAAANDGMLHAFDTDGAGAGGERWAFIPSTVLRNLPKLAASNYDANHVYYVDGSPVVGDICIATNCKATTVAASDWRTIMVGGLNSGGRGFYALDITNPTTAGVKLLWEFKVRDPAVTPCANAVVGTSTDCDLGLSFGNPVITKRKSDGKWVVILTSGYNNVNPGSGRGFLYVLDAFTGLVLNKIAQPLSAPGTAGTATPATCVPSSVTPTYAYCDADPSGFAKINVKLENNDTDNTALYVYGGDLKGNLWRYDLTSTSNTYPNAFLMATLKDDSNVAQPITVRPEVAVIPTDIPAVFIGTGKYIGTDDPAVSQQQTIYAIRADLTTTINPKGGTLVQQTLGGDVAVAGGTIRTVTSSATVDWVVKNGWYINLPLSGERINVDPSLQIGTLVMASNVPSSNSCTAGGVGYLNFFDYLTGRFVESSTNSAASRKVPGSLIVGTNTVKLPGNKLVTIATTADNQQLTFDTPIKSIGLGGRRVSWREVVSD